MFSPAFYRPLTSNTCWTGECLTWWVWGRAEPLVKAIIAGRLPDLDTVSRRHDLSHRHTSLELLSSRHWSLDKIWRAENWASSFSARYFKWRYPSAAQEEFQATGACVQTWKGGSRARHCVVSVVKLINRNMCFTKQVDHIDNREQRLLGRIGSQTAVIWNLVC